MRKPTRSFVVEVKRGDRHGPKVVAKPNNFAVTGLTQSSDSLGTVMRRNGRTFGVSGERRSATSIAQSEPQISTASCDGPIASPVATGRILPCLLSEPSLDRVDVSVQGSHSKPRKPAVKRIASLRKSVDAIREARMKPGVQRAGQAVSKQQSAEGIPPLAELPERARRRKGLTGKLPPGQRWKRRLPKVCW
jgi:hypothetical protein